MRTNLKSGRLAAAIAGAVVAAAFTIAPAYADVVGTMTCNIAPGEGAIVVSQRAVSCTFVSQASGPAQLYNGFINRLGVDIGNQTSGVLTYAVVAIGVPSPGALAGEYIGPGFGVSLGNGGGVQRPCRRRQFLRAAADLRHDQHGRQLQCRRRRVAPDLRGSCNRRTRVMRRHHRRHRHH